MESSLSEKSAESVIEKTRFTVLGAISLSHFLNDTIQSLILAIYPLLKGSFALSFTQIGLITLVYQITASLLQPLIGLYTDHRPKAYALVVGMTFSLVGLLTLATATHFYMLLVAAALMGTGSSIFHPEASRVARLASGGKHGLAQSIFQVGGNAGSAVGPLIAGLVIIPQGQHSIAWFSVLAIVAIIVMSQLGGWYKEAQLQHITKIQKHRAAGEMLNNSKAGFGLFILLTLIFSKFFYMTSFTSYYTFYLIEKFHMNAQSAQMPLFIFLFAVALGTILGGPIGDRIGRKRVIWFSILGAAPFTLLLPHADFNGTIILSFIIGLIIASAFSAIIVFAQELLPGKVGMVSGLFFGFAFGMSGIGAAVLGTVADKYGILYVYELCAYLPLLGILTVLLPETRKSSGK
jgi:FSR family fosmidomycin resistance protein-like MFS transporter